MQVIYETNIDYEASFQKLADSKVVVADKTQKGLLWVRFFDTKTVFMFSVNGTLQVTWHNLEEKQILFSLVQKLLVAKEGQELKVTPTRQLTWIPYNTPFKLNWCREEKEYSPINKTEKPIEKLGFFERRELNKNLEAERVAEEKRQLERSSNAALKALADHLDLKLTKTYFKNLEETEKS